MAEKKKASRRSKSTAKYMEEIAERKINPSPKARKSLDLAPGDNSKYVIVNMTIMNMPDIDLYDEEQVADRLNGLFALYAENDMKPTVAGMAMALNGHSRQWLHAVATGGSLGGLGGKPAAGKASIELIKKAYTMMEMMWEQYMYGGKINPVSGIFLGKNNFNYVDKVEHTVTPVTGDQSEYSVEDIKARYSSADIVEADPHEAIEMKDPE